MAEASLRTQANTEATDAAIPSKWMCAPMSESEHAFRDGAAEQRSPRPCVGTSQGHTRTRAPSNITHSSVCAYACARVRAQLLRHPSEPHAQTLRLLGRNAEIVGAVGLSLTGGESLASLCRESAAAAAATARGRLCEAAARGDVALMRAAIRGGALVGDSDAWGCNALHWAAAGGNADAVDLCLQA
eukprot:6198870-Pleurochrysis_carterae.AAC.1